MTFHYVRQREIIFILESADILYNKDKDYFKGVNVNEDGGNGKAQTSKTARMLKRFFGAGGGKPSASAPSPDGMPH